MENYTTTNNGQDTSKATLETTNSPNATALTLPPDPDGLNESRAGWASLALDAFQNTTGCEFAHMLPDLLNDLMHWCDRTGVSFDASLHLAQKAYAEETSATSDMTENKTGEAR
jgi:hypothetical protein